MKCANIKDKEFVGMFSTDAGGVSASATVNIILEETNDFPPQLVPLSSSLCSGDNKASPGVLLTAVDEDRHPQAAPFIFYIADPLPLNWTVFNFNGRCGR